MKRLFLIDGSSFFYRAFYAIWDLRSSTGQPTNAVFGVVTMLKKLLEEEKPDYLGIAFDTPGPTFRHVRFQGYKAHRPPMPEALVSQLPWIKEALKAFRISTLEFSGVEADDILGTVALAAAREGVDVYVVTSDKDALQLLGDQVKIYRPTREGHEILDEKALTERWGVKPDQIVDCMALMGDDVDAIPGVPGIGEKTAFELIQRFGSVEKLLTALKEAKRRGEEPPVRPALAKALLEHLEQVQMSRELATLNTQVPLKVELSDLKRQPPDDQKLRDLFRTLEFRTLLKELAAGQPRAQLQVESVSSDAEREHLLAACKVSKRAALVVGLSSPRPMEAEVVGVAVAWGAGRTALFPGEAGLKALESLWKDPQVEKVCPHLKEVSLTLMRHGLSMEGNCTDPCLASYLLHPERPSHEVAALAEEFLGEALEESDPLLALGREAEAALRLAPRLSAEIEAKALSTLLKEIEIPLAFVLARMELAGVAIDPAQLEALSKEMDRSLKRLTQEITRLSGEPFNLNSPRQLAKILFERLKLPVVKRTKTGASTDEEVLRRLSTLHELPAKILEYRELFKLSTTYVEALPQLVNPQTGRIHASFHQTVTATGRLSASNPNIQNIPIRTELGRQIRRAFVAGDPEKVLLAADYSQVELRILAHLSQDQVLIQAFREGQDIHRVTAAQIFGVKPEEITPDQRAAAKTINFGIVYGMTPFGLAKELGVSPPDAEEFIEGYFARYPGVHSYLQRSLEESRARGYCTTLFSRRRYLPEMTSKDPVVRQFAERTAINAPIQGSAADLIKVAMVEVDRGLTAQGRRTRMLLQVHDELVFEVPRSELREVEAFVKEVMETPVLAGKPVRLSVPIEVNLKTGNNWLEASH